MPQVLPADGKTAASAAALVLLAIAGVGIAFATGGFR